MSFHERFVVLVPVLVTVTVVLAIDHGSALQGSLAPFLYHAAGDLWRFFNRAVGMGGRG